MRFLMTYQQAPGAPTGPAKQAEITAFAEAAIKTGKLIDTGGLLPISQGARVKLASGRFTVTDGPFIETKEVIVGYAIVSVDSKEEAIEMSRAFMAIAGDGEGELRPMMGPGDGPHH